ncbi:MAG: glycoside hydrolase family 9 protein, partial [Planctomycetes bacterium]|nr:glycoside hydrolase family 9 protein [Planctomycetota bacterium]
VNIQKPNRTELDGTSVNFGFREAHFDKDGSFYLNGEKFKLIGLNRHQTYPYIGAAAPKRLQEKDADIVKYELGCNIVRTSHYPQSPHFLNRCDEIGLLVFEEIPGWQFIGDWQAGVLDVTVEAVETVAPDAAMLRQREALAKAEADAEIERAKAVEDVAQRAKAERAAALRRYGTVNPGSPAIVHVGLVAPDIIGVTIEAQRVVPPVFGPYEPQPGDVVKPEKIGTDRDFPMAKLWRGGKAVGWLQGRNLDHFATFERVEGDPLLTFLAEDAANWTIASADDPAFATPAHPLAVHRKSMPIDWLMGDNIFPARHRIYLKLPRPLAAGRAYTIAAAQVNLREREQRLVADTRTLRSEAVHANQIGYRPGDACKQAFLSLWLGSGGALAYPEGLAFQVIDEASGRDAFAGRAVLALAADATEGLGGKQVPNASRTQVWRLDFSPLSAPGRYRVHVDGIGCSYPFEIAASVWEKAFLVQMRGLYNNRCGVDLGPPYTTFRKPRDFHPADGVRVTRSTNDVLLTGDHSYNDFSKGDTGEAVPDAWGGYHDAGDWNPRRVSHMYTTLAQLELVEMFPAWANGLKLNIPPMQGIPDIITEALFEIDCFRRLQGADGGIPFGIESDGDPLPGEISWLSGQRVYVSAPNIRDSWFYAAVAGRAAKVLRPINPALADVYLQSARKAFDWAEADYARRTGDGSLAKLKELWRATDNRNLSALVLYELTGDKALHEVFVATTSLKKPGTPLYAWGTAIQADAAFLYARLDDAKADPELKRNAIAGILALAKASDEYAAGNAFNLTNREKYRPLFCGFFSTAGGTEQARAHYLTGTADHLAGVVRSTQFQTGCNPNNLVYTSGLGANPVRRPLHVDARQTGQAVPEGLTVFGNIDYWQWKGGFWDWPLKFINQPATLWPDAYAWPLTEAYFDINTFVSQNEFVIDTWAPNVFVWGYLAAQEAR